MNTLKSKAFLACYDNDITAFVPEQWAMETVMILVENMVAANLVHRDFEPEFKKFGETVHTRKPHEFTAERKGVNDDVVVQDAEADDIEVKLDQHVHVSFMIRDGEETKAFKSLVEEYLRPAALALARNADMVVLGQYAQFLANQATVGALTTSNAPAAITAVRNVQNKKKAPVEGRRLIVTPDAETMFLQNEAFFTAEKVGDNGTAMREASLGRKFQYDIFMCQNMASVASDATPGVGELTADFLKGATTLTVDGFGSDEVVPGDWIKLNGYVYHVTATDNATATSIDISPALFANAANNDDITVGNRAAVNQPASPTGYAQGYTKRIALDGLTSGANLAVGRLLSFGTANDVYVIIATDGSSYVVLDRALQASIANDAVIHLGPAGDYNLAFLRNAMTLAIRPLLPPSTGAKAAVINYNGVTCRVVITYDGVKQGHLVTLDFLAGIKVLDEDLGAVLNS